VRDEENAVHIDSDSLGVLRLQGKGAGGSATASAVLGDLLEAVRRQAQVGEGRRLSEIR
jgi:homoserine dehydrogenase